MSVESAWEEALASAGEVMDTDAHRYIDQARALALRVLRLEAENARLLVANATLREQVAALRRVVHADSRNEWKADSS